MLKKGPAEKTKQEILTNLWGYVKLISENYGEKPYIVTKNGTLTFKENNNRANAIQQRIIRKVPSKSEGIGLYLDDPLKIVPGLVGVLKSGNYFVPLDVAYPDITILHMIHTAEITLILSDSNNIDRVQDIVNHEVTVINIDEIDYNMEFPDPTIEFQPGDYVRILFTSGSLGEPKGAVEDYRFLARKIYTGLFDGDCELEDVILLLSTFAFSATWLVTIRSLLLGATLFFYDLKEDGFTNLPTAINDQKITVFRATPTVFRSFINTLNQAARFPSVQHAVVGGEKFTNHDLLAIHRHFPNVQYININFSSTETHRVSQSRLYLDQDLEKVLITAGHPCEDLKVLIWDEDGNPLPPDEEGEIVVYSDTLVQGYINNPKLTDQHFLPDTKNPTYRYYRTGDLGKLLPDGQLLHLGRVDNMVKKKGVRIELASIENHTLSHPCIVQATTRVIDDERGNRKIVLYYVPESGMNIPVSDLRKHLGERLPAHQLPQYYINLESLPLTSTGKVAIGKLPPPNLTRPDLPYIFEPPANQLERDLTRIWEDQLGIVGVGVCDDFFDLGGDSLLGVVLMVAIEEVTGKNLPVSMLLQAPTIRRQAELIRTIEPDTAFPNIIPIHPEGTLPPLFFIPGKGGYPTRIHHLVKTLDPEIPVYALQDLVGYNRPAPGTKQIKAIASLYLREMKNAAPRGPYILVGESMGGKICYEIAQQLVSRNEEQPLLFMLDTHNYADFSDQNRGKLNGIQYLKMLAQKHFNIWSKSDWEGKKEYLRFYRETFSTNVKRLLELKSELPPNNDPSQSIIPDIIRINEIRLEEASHNYVAEPYPGQVILVKAKRDPRSFNEANGWDRENIGKLIIYHLDCYHGSILFEPAVSQLAAIIQKYVRNIHKSE